MSMIDIPPVNESTIIEKGFVSHSRKLSSDKYHGYRLQRQKFHPVWIQLSGMQRRRSLDRACLDWLSRCRPWLPIAALKRLRDQAEFSVASITESCPGV